MKIDYIEDVILYRIAWLSGIAGIIGQCCARKASHCLGWVSIPGGVSIPGARPPAKTVTSHPFKAFWNQG